MIYRPENVLFIGIGVYLLVFLLSPLDALVSLELGSVAFIALTTFALVLGSRSADFFRVSPMRREVRVKQLVRIEKRLFWTVVAAGLLGNVLRLIDKYMLRGVGSLTGMDAREVLLEQSATPLSLVGGILYPFGYLPIFILLGSRVMPRTRWKVVLAAFIYLIPALDALTLFSRSLMLVSLAMVYFGLSLALYRGRVLPRQLLVPAFMGVVAVFSMSFLAFSWRLEQMSLDVMDSVMMSGYAHTVIPDQTVQAMIASGSSLGGLTVGILPITQYYVHGLLEFQILWDGNDTQTFSYGALLFAPYVKFLSMFGLAHAPDLTELFPRVGVFTSFWGPLWVDFGWLSLPVMFLFGFVSRMVAKAARRQDVGAIPLYTYFCVILFFMPVVNFAISAHGMYVINCFALFWFLTRKLARAVPV